MIAVEPVERVVVSVVEVSSDMGADNIDQLVSTVVDIAAPKTDSSIKMTEKIVTAFSEINSALKTYCG